MNPKDMFENLASSLQSPRYRNLGEAFGDYLQAVAETSGAPTEFEVNELRQTFTAGALAGTALLIPLAIQNSANSKGSTISAIIEWYKVLDDILEQCEAMVEAGTVPMEERH